jgi:transposase
MARSYSNDLRERVAALVLGGSTVRAAAAQMQVSVASAVRFAQAVRTTGSAAAKPMGGNKRPYLLAGQREFLLARLAEKPDLTLHALLDELRQRGVVVSCDTLWRFLRKEKMSFKKNTLSRRAGSARRCAPSRALEESPGEA